MPKLVVLNDDGTKTIIDSATLGGGTLSNSNASFQAFTDCIKATADSLWAFTVSGTGAAFTAKANANSNSIGILTFGLGTVATNRASIDSGNFSILNLGLGTASFESDCRFTVLSDATNTYTFRAGFIDSVSAESTDGVFFRYTNGTNSGKFQAVTRSNGTETAVDTGITVAISTWYDFEININATGTSAEFKINGTVVATITTNIPVGSGRETGYGVYVQRSVGTASVTPLDCDFVDVRYNFTNAR